jgi:hypothetical protein
MELLSQRLPDSQSALAALDQAVNLQARTLAMNDLFYLCAVVVMSVAVFAWLMPAHATSEESAT